MTFNHIGIDYPSLSRETVDGVRYYDTPNGKKLVSITSVISHYNREIFREWRAKVGEKEANKVTKQATSRGTDMHTLAEYYLKNSKLPSVQPLSEMLFKQAKPTLDKIDNIHAQEQSLFSYELGVAGSVDCIAEYEGELAIIDFKTAKKPKPKKWVDHHFVQCAAYACMLYEMTGIMVKKFVIIMSCENGEVVVYEEYDKRKYINLLSEYIREFVEFKLQEYDKT
jgi:CRISPR/Cas system-associated exonuclease Cas4 (RecB family)|tara:strand:+ start:1724 stop:2398 length:675 start_codon:yes stop_codon:yes gene_type:complete